MGDYRLSDTENNLVAIRDIRETVNENRSFIQKFLKGLNKLIVEVDGNVGVDVESTLRRTVFNREEQIHFYKEEVDRLRKRVSDLEKRVGVKPH